MCTQKCVSLWFEHESLCVFGVWNSWRDWFFSFFHCLCIILYYYGLGNITVQNMLLLLLTEITLSCDVAVNILSLGVSQSIRKNHSKKENS